LVVQPTEKLADRRLRAARVRAGQRRERHPEPQTRQRVGRRHEATHVVEHDRVVSPASRHQPRKVTAFRDLVLELLRARGLSLSPG